MHILHFIKKITTLFYYVKKRCRSVFQRFVSIKSLCGSLCLLGLLFYFYSLVGFRYDDVKCFSLIEETGSNYHLNAYYFFNLRSNYSTIYIRGKLDRNGETANINRRLNFITEFDDGNRIVLKDGEARLNFGDEYNGYDINTFIPLEQKLHDSQIIFDIYKQLDGSFIIQKQNGHMIYCNI